MTASLLALDPAVPHRDRLLDADAMHEPLSRIGGDAAWRVARVKYHPGRDLRVLYRAGAAGEHRLIVARTRSPSRRNVPRSSPNTFTAMLARVPDSM